MFRMLPHSLPRDPVFPPDLEKLGYFVNENDQIRKISDPEQKFQYAINRSTRVNDLHKEAQNVPLRKIIFDRLEQLGLEILRLPTGAAQHDNHVPILVSKDLVQKKRVVVFFGERSQELGILAGRVIGDAGIRQGSVIELVTNLLEGPLPTTESEPPGIIIGNPGQLLWYRGGQRAVTYSGWIDLPREYAVQEPFTIDPIKNKIPGNGDYVEHIEYVFEHVMDGLAAKDATFDIMALEMSGHATLRYLAKNWEGWCHRINAICLGSPQHNLQDLQASNDDGSESQPNNFADFISRRCRAYFVSEAELDTRMSGREVFGCSCYASGETQYQENIIVKAWKSMLSWFNLVHSTPGFGEGEFVVESEAKTNGHHIEDAET